MRLSSWVSIAEIASAVAVVVTLIVLVVGIRENTVTTRVAVYGDLIESLNSVDAALLDNQEHRETMALYFDPAVATIDEEMRQYLVAYLVTVFRNYERAWLSHEYEVIGDVEWGRFERLICQHYLRTKELGYDFSQAAALTMQFRDYILESCSEA